MQSRSWMAAHFVAVGLSLFPSLNGTRALASADDRKAGAPKKAAAPIPQTKTPATPKNLVTLDLKIKGLGPKGCDVEIKPANAGCKFQTQTFHLSSKGESYVDFKDIETFSADRDCTFAITIREKGQPEKTLRRGVRLKTEGKPGQVLFCYFDSPSRIARLEKEQDTIKR